MKHLFKTKLIFGLSIIPFVTLIVLGSFHLAASPYLLKDYPSLKIRTAYYGLRYSFDSKSQGTSAGIPVLVYHGILDESDGFSLDKSTFKEQLIELKKAGFQTITMQEFEQFMAGNQTLPEKSFLLTFDDGRKDSYYGSDPLLKALNYTAVMFVITERLGESPFHLSKKELAQMRNSKRWDLQSHGRSGHVNVRISQNESAPFFANKIWSEANLETDEQYRKRVSDDLRLSKQDLKDNFGIHASGFAFPFGAYGKNSNYETAKDVLLEEAQKYYSFAFYQGSEKQSPMNYPGAFMIQRIYVEPLWSGQELIKAMQPEPIYSHRGTTLLSQN